VNNKRRMKQEKRMIKEQKAGNEINQSWRKQEKE
jgi:hypothetical protein